MSSEQTTFDPQKYLTLIAGRDYLEVKWRLLWFRTENPDGTIETELKREDGKSALFAARISRGPGLGSATGWGSEEKTDFSDFIEKAETKAIGRALGALGYGTQFSYDFDTVDAEAAKQGQTQGVVDSPVQQPVRALPSAARPVPRIIQEHQDRAADGGFARPTDKQAKYLWRLGAVGEFGNDGKADNAAWSQYRGIPEGELTGNEVKKAIDFFVQREQDGKNGSGDLPPFAEVIGRTPIRVPKVDFSKPALNADEEHPF